MPKTTQRARKPKRQMGLVCGWRFGRRGPHKGEATILILDKSGELDGALCCEKCAKIIVNNHRSGPYRTFIIGDEVSFETPVPSKARV